MPRAKAGHDGGENGQSRGVTVAGRAQACMAEPEPGQEPAEKPAEERSDERSKAHDRRR